MARGWEGDKVRLVPLDKERHFESALRWLNDPEITRWLLVGDFPISRLREEEWFDRMMREGENEIGFAIETLHGEHIGFSGIHRIQWQHRTGVTGTMIGPPENWGKGYGTDAIRVRTRYAFEVLGLQLLLSEALVGNDRSIRTLERAGYKRVGIVPGRYWKRGALRDVLTFYRRRDDAGR